MKGFKNVWISFEEMQQLISHFSPEQVKFGKPEASIITEVWIFDKDTKCEVYQYFPEIKQKMKFICEKELGQEIIQHKTGRQAHFSMRTMSKHDGFEIPDLSKDQQFCDIWLKDEDTGKFEDGQRAILYYNQERNGRATEGCFSYDVNSSFTAAMLKWMPDTRNIRYSGEVGVGEIGFLKNYGFFEDNHSVIDPVNQPWLVVFEGYADVICPKISGELLFGRFAAKYYKQKKTALTKESKVQAKEMLNFGVGYFQLTNPLIRTAIIYWSNKNILDHIDSNTLFANTDCIVSRGKRDDIMCGNELGDFKIDHTGTFKYIGLTCQWNLETPKWRGVPKKDFKDGFDMLRDDLPTQVSRYRLNKETLKFDFVGVKRQ